MDELVKKVNNPTSDLSKGKLWGQVDKTEPWTTKSEPEEKNACQKAADEWSYLDIPAVNGPNNWYKTFPKCGVPNVQSPVELPLAIPSKAEIFHRKLVFTYRKSKITLQNDGRNLIALVGPGGTMSVSGSDQANGEAVLQYLTFHSPAEHVFTNADGVEERYAMEVQYHHRQEDGRVVVVAVPLKVNAASPLLEGIFKNKIPEKCQDESVHDEFNLEDLMPMERHFYMYYGTLTQPPCTNDVTWYVMRSPAHLSLEQLQMFRKAMRLDKVERPNDLQPVAAGTSLGGQKVKVVDQDQYPDYEYSATLNGNVRPAQPLGPRKLWATPDVVS